MKRLFKISTIITVALLFFAFLYRFGTLGYGEFQGDEVKVQGFLFSDGSFWEFLMTRTIGPGEFIVTYVVNTFIKPQANYEFFVRLPFAVAGFLTIVLLYFFVKKFLNTATALIALSLMSLSGFFIAFSRIVQYQSFVLLFSTLSVFAFGLFLISPRTKFLFVSGLSGGLGLLFHYDALSFIIPTIIAILIMKKFREAIYFLVPLFVIALVFYLPLVFSPEFSETWRYLLKRRISVYFPFDSLYYSLNLLNIYHSKEFLLLMLLGVGLWLVGLVKRGGKLLGLIIMTLVVILIIRILWGSPRRLFIYPSMTLWGLIALLRLRNFKKAGRVINFVELWFLFSFLIYGLYIRKPLTHIYNYLIPLFILVSYHLAKLWKKYPILLMTAAFIGLLSSISFNYQAFLETKTEYPWEEERYIFGGMFPKLAKGEKWEGIFGFPHKSNLREIEEELKKLGEETDIYRYSTNEKYKLVKYYLRDFNSSDVPPYYFIYIKNPHSLDTATKPNWEPIIKRETYSIFVYE